LILGHGSKHGQFRCAQHCLAIAQGDAYNKSMLKVAQTHPPPPDYTQRHVKLRLFAGLAAIMFFAAVIELQAWKWVPALVPSSAAGGSLNNRLDDATSRTAFDPAGTFVAISDASSSIRDDTAVLRPAEREAWFETVSRVRDLDFTEARKSSLGRVAYLQLFRQPDEYRGKLVTVFGTVRLAYRVAATDNELGIEEYFVYWLQPAGGPDSPILVYALEAPPGFPGISEQNKSSESAGKLHEEVEVTGVFFKRAAYAAKGGTYTAPLIIAKVPDWKLQAPDRASAELPVGPVELMALLVAALLLAICAGAVFWKRSGRPRQFSASTSESLDMNLKHVTLGPTTEQSLRQLGRDASGVEDA
jgi:hypothetical protein